MMPLIHPQRWSLDTGDPTAELGTVLGVWAHPDDEAYLSAGLMALARRHGRRVVVVTATAGEHGTDDPDCWPPARLARSRRKEMAASLAAIGVDEHRWLGYSDGACADADEGEAITTIGEIIDAVEPHTIVTFGPDGMTGHPDHCAVSAWTTAAWASRRRHYPGSRLWYATLLPSFHQEWGGLNDVDRHLPRRCRAAGDTGRRGRGHRPLRRLAGSPQGCRAAGPRQPGPAAHRPGRRGCLRPLVVGGGLRRRDPRPGRRLVIGQDGAGPGGSAAMDSQNSSAAA